MRYDPAAASELAIVANWTILAACVIYSLSPIEDIRICQC